MEHTDIGRILEGYTLAASFSFIVIAGIRKEYREVSRFLGHATAKPKKVRVKAYSYSTSK